MQNDIDVRNFIIESTGGDQTVELYDEWCIVSEIMQYDHVSANKFIMSTLENNDPGVILNKIMNGFAVAAHSQAVNTGIILNPSLSYKQLLTWVKTMSKLGDMEDYSFIKDILYSDLEPKNKIQRIFEIIGPGTDPEYEGIVFSVESNTIDGLKTSIEEIATDPALVLEKQKTIQNKIQQYSNFKTIITGEVYSDKFAGLVSCFNMDIDTYLTPMKENIDFYNDPENWDVFFIDVFGCLILSNTLKEDYVKSMEAAVYEFFNDDLIRPKVLIEMNKAITRLPL
jgi:hypothetical protein